jgi:hypothetical protein
MDESAVQKDKGYSEISVSPRWAFCYSSRRLPTVGARAVDSRRQRGSNFFSEVHLEIFVLRR